MQLPVNFAKNQKKSGSENDRKLMNRKLNEEDFEEVFCKMKSLLE